MSLIGLRPQTHRCFKAFDAQTQKIISKVRPGLSGMGSIVFRNEELMLDDSADSIYFYDSVIAPYKGIIEQWYVKKRGVKIYCQLIYLTVIYVFFPNSLLAWKLFPDLPKPPDELKNYFKEN